jgi:acyl-coenzyme A thioesterase PaaI-like protein
MPTDGEEDPGAYNRRRRDEWRTALERAPFAALCSLHFDEWSEDEVVLRVGFRDELTSYPGTLHGGLVATALDVAALGAVMAGNDFTMKGRHFTASMTVQYLSSDSGRDLLVTARCTRRGASITFVEAHARSDRGKLLADAMVSICRAATG